MQQQRLSQNLQQKLTPQQIQVIKLLQVPTAQLEQRIKDELEDNPALEEGYEQLENKSDPLEEPETKEQEDLDVTDYLADDDYESFNYYQSNRNEEIPFGFGLKQDESFHDHLIKQLGFRKFNDQDKILAEHLIGMIEEDGYLRRPLLSINDDLAFSKNIFSSVAELESILKRIQDFEPAGIGARDLRECLLIQLRADQSGTRSVEDAEMIIEKYFDDFSKKKYDQLQKKLKLDENSLKAALDEILQLNPKPGNIISSNSNSITNYIIPDYQIKNQEGELIISLNGKNAPDLRVSGDYQNMLKGYAVAKDKTAELKNTVNFIKQKIDAAKWFIDAIKQRQETMLLIMDAIVSKQYDYFLTNDPSDLKPMILKDIAQVTGFDISTISRITSNKYVQTEFGTYLLKDLFTEKMTTDTGEEISANEIKYSLEELCANEDKKKPLSDQKLTDLLNQKGFNVARRTVAKYREQLNLPVARLRKEI